MPCGASCIAPGKLLPCILKNTLKGSYESRFLEITPATGPAIRRADAIGNAGADGICDSRGTPAPRCGDGQSARSDYRTAQPIAGQRTQALVAPALFQMRSACS